MKNNAKRWTVFFVFSVLLAGCAAAPAITDEEQKILSEIMEMLNTNIKDAQGNIQLDPESADNVEGLVKVLHEKRKFIKQVEAGEIPFDPESMVKIATEAKEIKATVRRPVEKTWSADVHFGLGKYKVTDLSQHETENLKGLIREITEIVAGIVKKLPQTKQLVIFVKTFGYADGTAICQKTKNSLIKNMKVKLPRSKPSSYKEMKNFLNTEISRRRSESVNEYVRTELKAGLKYPQVSLSKTRTISMGETYPCAEDTVSPPYQSKDERRRLCKIYMTITVKNR